MNYYKPIIFFVIAIIIVGAIFWAVRTEYYPVAFVNFNPILSRDYEATFIAMNNFINTQSIPLILENNFTETELKDPSFIKNLKKYVLTEMIKNEITRQGIKKLNIDDLNKKVESRIAASLASKENNTEFLKGLEVLYGLRLDRFKELILVPFVIKEIAFEEKKIDNFAEWFQKEREKAKVYILLKNMKWDRERGEVVRQ